MGETTTQQVSGNDSGKRLDRVVRRFLPGIPLGALAKLIRTGAIRVNDRKARHNTRVTEGDSVQFPADLLEEESERIAGARRNPAEPVRKSATTELSVPVIHLDTDVLVLNKPAGIPVHGPQSLTVAVQDHVELAGWVEPSMSFRAGPVHRLDANTSGVQVFALSVSAARSLSEAIRDHRVRKAYLAVVKGAVQTATHTHESIAYDKSTRTARVGTGKPAASWVVPIASDQTGNSTLVLVWTESGRTHQVRAHLSALGFPLLGDGKYGGGGFDLQGSAGMANGYGDVPRVGTGEAIRVPVQNKRTPPTYLLHAVAFCAPESTWWTPLPPEMRRVVAQRFGSIKTISERVTEEVGLHCAGTIRNGRITV